MPHWISDPPTSSYLILVICCIVACGLWMRSRQRVRAIVLGVCVFLLVGLYVCDRLIESPREEAVRRVESMGDAIAKKSWPQLAEHISPDFEFRGLKKNDLKRGFDLAAGFDTKVTVWNFEREAVQYLPNKAGVEITFDAKGESGDRVFPAHFVAVFRREPDGKYLLRSFSPRNIIDKRDELQIPGVP